MTRGDSPGINGTSRQIALVDSGMSCLFFVMVKGCVVHGVARSLRFSKYRRVEPSDEPRGTKQLANSDAASYSPRVSRLERLGLSSAISSAFAGFRAEVGDQGDPRLGRVGRVDRGEVDVFAEEGDLRAVSDSQRAQAVLAPVTGDWVVVAEHAEIGLQVARVLPRRTALVRRDPAEQVSDQVLVANVDRVAVVHGMDVALNDARIERFLILAIDSGAEPLVIVTKSDVATPTPGELDWLEGIAPVVVTSSVDGSGLDPVRGFLRRGETMVLIGPSGVGKSTLVNAIVGAQVAATGEVREGDRRGRHTTTVRDLIEVPGGGVIIDTPGIRAIGLWAADIALDQVFADIAELATVCRFRDCTHRQEPGCAVAAAVVENRLSPQRLARYQTLWQELAQQSVDAQRRVRPASTGKRNKRRRG